jgi:hypothetical protein
MITAAQYCYWLKAFHQDFVLDNSARHAKQNVTMHWGNIWTSILMSKLQNFLSMLWKPYFILGMPKIFGNGSEVKIQ